MADIYSQASNTDLNAPVATAQGQKGQLDTLFTGQRADTNVFSTGLKDYINGSPTQAALAERIGGELGLPDLRANSLSLQNTLYNIPQTYGTATRGFDVNGNQLAQIIARKQYELGPVAERATANTQNAENQLTQRLGYAQQDFTNRLIPYQSDQQLLTDRMARETTGYTTQMQSELNAIIAKMNAGVTLNEGDKNRANTLAIAEKQYQAQVDAAKISNQRPIANNGFGFWDPAQNKVVGQGFT